MKPEIKKAIEVIEQVTGRKVAGAKKFTGSMRDLLLVRFDTSDPEVHKFMEAFYKSDEQGNRPRHKDFLGIQVRFMNSVHDGLISFDVPWEQEQFTKNGVVDPELQAWREKEAAAAEKRKDKVKAREDEVPTTCQICERHILANTGVIAHHGYQRPYKSGWQTGSCLGARFWPYERSCERLEQVIPMIERYIEERISYLKNFIANPPKEITERKSWNNNKERIYERPEGFDPIANEKAYHRRPYTYEAEYEYRRHTTVQTIDGSKGDLARLKKRLAAWVAPAS